MLEKIKNRLCDRLYAYDLQQFAKKTEFLSQHIQPGMRVLDVGCGDGRLGQYVQGQFDCAVTGVDTIPYLSVELPFMQYDGDTLPFDDKAFDVAICLAVIHHADNPERLLCEIHRVARKVILIEDYCSKFMGKCGLHLNDYFTNIVQNVYKVWSGYRRGRVFDMQWRLQFRTEGELRDIFQKHAMQLESFTRTQPSWKGMSHGVYVLQ
jgi:ubiquinone/menaquinone biosynthesis C-methylase UbiE